MTIHVIKPFVIIIKNKNITSTYYYNLRRIVKYCSHSKAELKINRRWKMVKT